MQRCVNINHPEFKELLEQSGVDPISLAADISIWQDRNDTDLFPTLEQLVPPVEKVEYRFAAVDKILAKLPILNKWWKDKSISKETFWKKFKELGIPNDQVELYKESNADTFEQVVLDTLAKYSFEVEITRNVIETDDSTYFHFTLGNDFYSRDDKLGTDKNDFSNSQVYKNSQQITIEEFKAALEEVLSGEKYANHYSNLTVPGGTNYQELEIKTPDIIPLIKGHASFSSDSGAGWFRVDDLDVTSSVDDFIKRLEKQGTLKIKCD